MSFDVSEKKFKKKMSIPIKLVMLGESGVGKTSVIDRYTTGNFPEASKPTIGAAFLTKEVRFNDTCYDLMIWDTAGQEEYRGLAPMYYRNASVAIVMFDITNQASFDAVDYWIKDLKDNAGPEICVILCGNKTDKEKEEGVVNQSAVLDFAQSQGISYVTTSALTGEGVDMLFQTAVTVFAKTQKTPISLNQDQNIENNDSRSYCC